MTRLPDHDLSVLVEAAAKGATNSWAAHRGGTQWDDMTAGQKNMVRETALPFIFHGTKALAELGYSKLGASAGVLAEIADERGRQDAKWGEQNHPNGTGPQLVYAYTGPAAYVADTARSECQRLSAEGLVTFADILLEEVAEALAEADQALLRAELIQVAAVAAQWVEAIDRAAVRR